MAPSPFLAAIWNSMVLGSVCTLVCNNNSSLFIVLLCFTGWDSFRAHNKKVRDMGLEILSLMGEFLFNDCAIREVKEETGLDITVGEVLMVTNKYHWGKNWPRWPPGA
ncbi:hypothetical protein ACS0TY_008268 [Phlomoides rotata]